MCLCVLVANLVVRGFIPKGESLLAKYNNTHVNPPLFKFFGGLRFLAPLGFVFEDIPEFGYWNIYVFQQILLGNARVGGVFPELFVIRRLAFRSH